MHITDGKTVTSNSSLTVTVKVHLGNRFFPGQTVSLPLQASYRPGKKLSYVPPLSPTGNSNDNHSELSQKVSPGTWH